MTSWHRVRHLVKPLRDRLAITEKAASARREQRDVAADRGLCRAHSGAAKHRINPRSRISAARVRRALSDRQDRAVTSSALALAALANFLAAGCSISRRMRHQMPKSFAERVQHQLAAPLAAFTG